MTKKHKQKEFTLYDVERTEQELAECLQDSQRVISVSFTASKSNNAWRTCHVKYRNAERDPVLYRFYHMIADTIAKTFDCETSVMISFYETGVEEASIPYCVKMKEYVPLCSHEDMAWAIKHLSSKTAKRIKNGEASETEKAFQHDVFKSTINK